MKRKRSLKQNATRGQTRSNGKLRIIGGDFRRRQLPVLDLPGLRPTPDRVRETLFNWLGQTLYGQRVLDAFAGTGALGIEALSRGAAHVDFVEQDAGAAAQLQQNLDTLQTDKGHVARQDVQAFLAQPPAMKEPFDLVLLDPPFHQGLIDTCCEALETGGRLAPEALIYLEAESSLMPAPPENWQLYRQTRAGETTARLYRRESP
ncbi:MAG: 16S rRNA (guanine(966)-N(2))-methyltransferase RsmD [Halomonas sp.]|nr:16S rRNA (guanine(966)-N(2))-methyltransferase RsmD [Halomonas sp.]MDN6297585.1 16S rRNA (guanine(966)-N(2))-methyltransferase RsmD [Halomonas sp.]MDN6314270.1 16S rRNA (guanine(966)-N(2))-methyltransferase RsmD [Halomonas sp.]MDN6335047.1 16S rRNA (guanine(966)-N(2))-methyltransferase RsmD [Halomonas sp.]